MMLVTKRVRSPSSGSAARARERLLRDPVMRCSARTLAPLAAPTELERSLSSVRTGGGVLSPADQRQQLLDIVASAFESFHLAALHYDQARQTTTAIIRPASFANREADRAVRVDAYGNLSIAQLGGMPQPQSRSPVWQRLMLVVLVLVGALAAVAVLVI